MTGRKLELTPGNLIKIGVQREAIVPLEED